MVVRYSTQWQVACLVPVRERNFGDRVTNTTASKPAAGATGKLEAKTVFQVAEVRRVEKLIDPSGIVAVLEPLLPRQTGQPAPGRNTVMTGTTWVAFSRISRAAGRSSSMSSE